MYGNYHYNLPPGDEHCDCDHPTGKLPARLKTVCRCSLLEKSSLKTLSADVDNLNS
jgi:hypothetical protein